MVNPEKLCMGCMSPLDGEGPCRFCGYQGSGPSNADDLVPGTVLDGRYLTGRARQSNGESTVYIGYDMQEDFKVFVRELMPRGLVARNHSTMELRPLKDRETAFKSLVAEFGDICSRLKSINTLRSITQVIDIVYENNTVYAIYRYAALLPLSDLVTQCGGEIKWSKCKKLFLSLLNTLSQVHKKGLIHAGISPRTILIDEKGSPYLSGFSVVAARALNNGIDCELFDGYSAPEQYENKHCYGEWTDVYALCAVLYRTITGTMPPGAQDRKLGDNLVDACDLDPSIPENVSDAIHNGMMLQTDARTQTADELSMQLLDNTDTNTAVYSVEVSGASGVPNPAGPSLEEEGLPLTPEEQSQARKEARRTIKRIHRARKKRRSLHMMVLVFVPMLLTVGVLIVVLFYLFQYNPGLLPPVGAVSSSSHASGQMEPAVSEEEVPDVPDLVGQYLDKITANAEYALLFDVASTYEYNDSFAEGVVFDQSPKSGKPMPESGVVKLSVSKGKDTIKLPKLEGSSLELASQTLAELDLRYDIRYIKSNDYANNMVLFTDPPADTSVKRTDKGLTVLIYVRDPATASVSEPPASSSENEENEKDESSKPAVRWKSSSSSASSKR